MRQEEIRDIAKIAVDAGKAILTVYNSSDFGVERKDDNSPLTSADTKSHKLINKGLSNFLVDGELLSLISEEGTEVPYEERKNWKRYWLIDPLDGTKEFIKKNGEFTVNIALIEEGLPTAGFVYVPVNNILYFGSEDFGSYKLTDASKRIGSNIFDYSEKLQVHDYTSGTVKVVASRSHLTSMTEDYISRLENRFDKVSIVSSGSSIKLCMAADGSAHVYPRFAPTMEWDTAAAHAVCRYAGAKVIDYKTKKEMKYNKKSLLNNWFLVSTDEQFAQFVQFEEFTEENA